MIRRALLVLDVGLTAALALPPLWYAVFPEPTPGLPRRGGASRWRRGSG